MSAINSIKYPWLPSVLLSSTPVTVTYLYEFQFCSVKCKIDSSTIPSEILLLWTFISTGVELLSGLVFNLIAKLAFNPFSFVFPEHIKVLFVF